MKTDRKDYILYAPQNSWDTNYHLIDDKNKIEYLIDICDVTDDINDEDGYLHIEILLNLEDIEEILMYAWNEKPYISDCFSNLISGTKKTIDQLLLTI